MLKWLKFIFLLVIFTVTVAIGYALWQSAKKKLENKNATSRIEYVEMA